MIMKNKIITFLLVCLMNTAFAQRAVEFVIPFPQGGSADRTALILITYMREEFIKSGLTPVLSYRPGAGSILATASVVNSDRLQIFMAPNGVVTSVIVNPTPVTYDIKQDLVPLEYIGHIPALLVVNSKSKFKTIQDIQQECQQRPIVFGSAGVGSITHIASAIVLAHLKCPSTHIPYKGVGPALVDLQGSHIDMVTDFVASVRTHIEANTFRPLLSVGQHKNPDYPNLPSMGDIGYLNYEIDTWFVLAVGAKVPAADIAIVQPILHRMMQRTDLRKQLQENGLHGIGTKMPPNFFVVEHSKFERILKRIELNDK